MLFVFSSASFFVLTLVAHDEFCTKVRCTHVVELRQHMHFAFHYLASAMFVEEKGLVVRSSIDRSKSESPKLVILDGLGMFVFECTPACSALNELHSILLWRSEQEDLLCDFVNI